MSRHTPLYYRLLHFFKYIYVDLLFIDWVKSYKVCTVSGRKPANMFKKANIATQTLSDIFWYPLLKTSLDFNIATGFLSQN